MIDDPDVQQVMAEVTQEFIKYQQDQDGGDFADDLQRAEMKLRLVQRKVPHWAAKLVASVCPRWLLPGITVIER